LDLEVSVVLRLAQNRADLMEEKLEFQNLVDNLVTVSAATGAVWNDEPGTFFYFIRKDGRRMPNDVSQTGI
jgi:hypothetical protein